MAIHFTEMLRLLDRAYQYRSLVDIYAWEGGTGEVIHYKGWLVHHVNWRGGYVRLRNPKARGNRLLRTVPQVFIFRINNQQVNIRAIIMAILWSLRLQLQIKTGSVATASCRQVSTIRLP